MKLVIAHSLPTLVYGLHLYGCANYFLRSDTNVYYLSSRFVICIGSCRRECIEEFLCLHFVLRAYLPTYGALTRLSSIKFIILATNRLARLLHVIRKVILAGATTSAHTASMLPSKAFVHSVIWDILGSHSSLDPPFLLPLRSINSAFRHTMQ